MMKLNIFRRNKMGNKPYKIYVYRCVNISCRHVEERGGMLRSSMRCPHCDHRMQRIGERYVPQE